MHSNSSGDPPLGAAVDDGDDRDECVSALVDRLARIRPDRSGQPLGLYFEVLGGDDSPPVNSTDA